MPANRIEAQTQSASPEVAAGGGTVGGEQYRPAFKENLEAFMDGIALRCARKDVLIVGPYVGEFGHEIMGFQSFVRGFRDQYREIHVITFPGREPLYRGCNVHSHDFELKNAGYSYGRISHEEINRYAHEFAKTHQIRNYDLFSTRHLSTRWHRRFLFRQKQEIIGPLEPAAKNQKLLFHLRNIDKRGPDKSRNFRPDLAAELCELCRRNGFEIACIGHPRYALCPEGCEDLRTEDLEKTVGHMAACRMVVGELSGPLHLAVYCGKPIVIWAPGKDRIDYAFKRNPFQVRIFVVRDDTTNPEPNEILETIKSAAKSLA